MLALTILALARAARAEEPTCALFTRLGAAQLTTPPQVRGRPALPDAHAAWMPAVAPAPGPDFPAVFRYDGESEPAAAGAALRDLVDGRARAFGAVVARGLPATDAASFASLVAATGLPLRHYVGGVTSRPEVAPYVAVISEERADLSMEPHQDNPYWVAPPTRLAIFVERPPAAGGEALLSDARRVLRTLNATRPALVAALVERGVRYDHFYPHERAAAGITSWQRAFGATKSEAERVLRDGGFGFEWQSDGGLRKWEVAPAVAARFDEPCWFNMVSAMHCSVFDNHPDYPELHRPDDDAGPCAMTGAMPYHTRFGDGAEFAPADIAAVRAAQWAHAVAFDYAAGDVVVVDNYFAMHGRFSFSPPRDLFITMVGS